MRKIFLAMFGGTPARGELCLYLNAAAGLYQGCDGIQCYPIDKDTESPNYVNTRNLYNKYRDFREIVQGTGMADIEIVRAEDMFEKMLGQAGIKSGNETIQYLMADENGIGQSEQRLLNACFTEDEQIKNMKGGYYGKASIGSVTGDILIEQGIYDNLNLYKDIKNSLKSGNELDVVIICSSFGGTGASLGINFGEYLRKKLVNENKLRIHCIYIQPYFSFPEPEADDKWKMDSKQFYAKSATVTAILGQKEHFIKSDEEEAVFDRFYYLGQEVLDNISEKNSAVDNQDNHIHMVDMLVGLAVQDILMEKQEMGPRIYGYQYANEGTEGLSWKHMPSSINFEAKHVNMMRFCGFMLDCIEPFFAEDFKDYEQEALIVHLYGYQWRGLSKRADITEGIKKKFHEDMRKCFEFCRSYIKYWMELEIYTQFGGEETQITHFFNLNELVRVLESKNEDFNDVRASADPLKLTETHFYSNFKKGKSSWQIFNSLLSEKSLKGIAGSGRNKKDVAKTLVKMIYEKCMIEN